MYRSAELAATEGAGWCLQEFDTDVKERLTNLDKMTETVTMMTQHEKADREITECRERREKAEKVSTEWVEKTQKLVKQWEDLNNTVSGAGDEV